MRARPKSRHRRLLLLRCALLATVAVPTLAHADGVPDPTTLKLIQLLIQKGILTQGQATTLLTQAGAGPARPRHGHRAAQAAPPPDEEAPPVAVPGEVRVTYVPKFVRDQIASEVRGQVMQQVRDEGWAKPDQVPDWIHRIEVYGDLRLRYQGDFEDKGNYPLFPDFNAINAGSGFDLSGGSGNVPTLNTIEDRNRYRIRARLGVRARIADWISADVRIATGNDNSPVSENQTLGQPGDFSKYAIYVDRAYLTLAPTPTVKIEAGRTPNPYFVSDLMFAPDLNFDGAALKYDQPLPDGLGVFVNAGAHPVFNTSLNFSSTDLVKGSSHDAYLFAAQAGARWRISDNDTVKLGVGYFAYSNITGKESAPCLLLASSDTCSTDDTRPGFLQFGNTVFPIRDIVTNSSSIAATPQYYGLASHFGILDVHGRFDIHNYDPVVVSLEGEFVKNLEYNRSYILARVPTNNYGSVPVTSNATNGPYQGGNTGYLGKLTIGYPEIRQRWDWNVSVAYKYLQSDSVVDAFVDPDFHRGGTNAKGYVVGGNLGVAPDASVAVRWLSADEVSGPPYRNDVLQVDLNTKF